MAFSRGGALPEYGEACELARVTLALMVGYPLCFAQRQTENMPVALNELGCEKYASPLRMRAGHVFINGVEGSLTKYKSLVGFVPQEVRFCKQMPCHSAMLMFRCACLL